MGARLRLKAGKDISGYAPEVRKIFQAMKTYGLIVADNGSDMYIQGTYDTRWDNDVLNPAFASLHATDFEVVQLGWQGGSAPPPPSCQPGPPSNLWSSVNGYTVQIGWTPPSTSYLGHYVDVGSGPGLTNITSIPVPAPAAGLGGTVPAGRYYVRARTAASCGTGTASNEIVVDVPSGCAVPTAPGTLSFSVVNRTVSLSWGAAGSATSYRLEAGSSSGAANILNTSVGSALSVGGPVPPGTYYVRVRGLSNCGQAGAASNEVIVTVS